VNVYGQLGERTSLMVREALKRKCEVCHADPGADCINIVNGHPLEGRVVHYARTVD
jgi:hypothetical protein